MFHLLQIVDTVSKTLQNTSGSTGGEPLSFFDLIVMGGWVMVPLGLMLLLAVYFFAERYIAIRHVSKLDSNFMNIIRDHIVSGNVVAARSFAKNTNNPVAHIIDKGIQRIGKPIDSIEKSMDNGTTGDVQHGEKPCGTFFCFQSCPDLWVRGNPDRSDAIIFGYPPGK